MNKWHISGMFTLQLDKVYDPDAPEDDMMERYEEMNRMREHVMKEVDKDNDAMISYREFVDSTNQKDFEKDEGWDVSVIARFLFTCNTILCAWFLFQFFQSVHKAEANYFIIKALKPECFQVDSKVLQLHISTIKIIFWQNTWLL